MSVRWDNIVDPESLGDFFDTNVRGVRFDLLECHAACDCSRKVCQSNGWALSSPASRPPSLGPGDERFVGHFSGVFVLGGLVDESGGCCELKEVALLFLPCRSGSYR